MKKCKRAIYLKTIVSLTLSIVLVFASVSSLFALEAELEAAPDYGVANALNNPLLLERSPTETVLSAEDTTLNSSDRESNGLEYSNNNLTLNEIASTILSNELEVSIPTTQAASQPISPSISFAAPPPMPLRMTFDFAEGTILPAPVSSANFGFGITPLSPPPAPCLSLYLPIYLPQFPSTVDSMRIFTREEASAIPTDGSLRFPEAGTFVYSVTQGQNTNHNLPNYLNIIYSPAEYELRIYVAEYEWIGGVYRIIADVTATVVVPDSPNPNAPEVGTKVDELVFTNILEVNEDLYNPICVVCRQPSWSYCICPASTYHEPCENCNEYPCACDKSTPTTPTPSPGPKTGDDTNQSKYLIAMIVTLEPLPTN